MDREIITRRRLPHWYIPGAAQFVIYRLADTLPASVRCELNRWRDERLNRPLPEGLSAADYRLRVHKQLFARYDDYLDRHREVSWLADPRVAAMARSNLYHHHGSKYHLMAYCIMPNHVHVLLLPTPAGTQAACPTGACRIVGSFWQRESYDHWVRDDDELERIVNYIRGNPVEAGLTERCEDWEWSSCHDRFLHDGNTSGWLVSMLS